VKRFKSIDIFRGFILLEMVWVHICSWWLKEDDLWLSTIPIPYVDRVAGPGFVFIAGISITLFVRSRLKKVNITDEYTKQMVRNEYYLRSIFLFLVAFGYNIGVAILFKNPALVWTWFVVFTIAVSLLMAWPLFKTPKLLRLFFAILFWIINYFVLSSLLPFQGQENLSGFIFHILYNNLDLDPILSFFSFLIIGTVVGDILFEVYQYDDKIERRLRLKNKLLFPSLFIGITLIILSFIYGYPHTLNLTSFSWISFSLGANLVLLTILIAIEEFDIIKTDKNYRFLYFFSFYSLTIYLSHNLLYFLFLRQLPWILSILLNIGTIILIGLIFRATYQSSWRNNISLKFQLGRLAKNITIRIEKRKKRGIKG